ADAVAALAQHSTGLPRLVNHLAEGALALAALRGAAIVDGALVSAVAAERSGSPAAAVSSHAQSPSPAADPGPVAEAPGEDIPVLTETIEGEHDGAALDPAATMTLLDDDLDEISAEIAAEMLAVDAAPAVLDAAEAVAEPASETTSAADAAAAESTAAKADGAGRKQRRSASG